jgi:hypothetical protein
MPRALLTSCLAAVALLVVALPATAEIFTVTLHNGTTFNSRYQPEEAPWDTSKVILLDDVGVRVALPKADIESIAAQSELKGYGRVIDTTTFELGVAPNDLPEPEEGGEGQAQQPSALDRMLSQSYDQQQFVEPDEAGGGVPVFSVGNTTQPASVSGNPAGSEPPSGNQ